MVKESCQYILVFSKRSAAQLKFTSSRFGEKRNIIFAKIFYYDWCKTASLVFARALKNSRTQSIKKGVTPQLKSCQFINQDQGNVCKAISFSNIFKLVLLEILLIHLNQV